MGIGLTAPARNLPQAQKAFPATSTPKELAACESHILGSPYLLLEHLQSAMPEKNGRSLPKSHETLRVFQALGLSSAAF
jgi:hypothetical protein